MLSEHNIPIQSESKANHPYPKRRRSPAPHHYPKQRQSQSSLSKAKAKPSVTSLSKVKAKPNVIIQSKGEAQRRHPNTHQKYQVPSKHIREFFAQNLRQVQGKIKGRIPLYPTAILTQQLPQILGKKKARN